jgi:hypothetical protein
MAYPRRSIPGLETGSGMSGAEELPWMALAIMGGTTFIILWAFILARIALWLFPLIFPETKE